MFALELVVATMLPIFIVVSSGALLVYFIIKRLRDKDNEKFEKRDN
jgi:hypothetical protein